MFPKSKKRSGSISSIKYGNKISSFSYLRHVLAEIDGVSSKELVSANWG
jgi:hypothetical protein